MQSYEEEGIAACVPNVNVSRADNTGVKSPFASHLKKPMSEGHSMDRPSAIHKRSRIQFERRLNDLIAPLFHYLTGVVAFRFPDDGVGNLSVAAWLLDGDLMYCPAENGKKPSSWDQSMVDVIPVAKFRLNSGLSLQKGAKLEGAISCRRC